MQEPTTLINRTIILNSLKQRNIKEKENFYDLIKSRKEFIYFGMINQPIC
jgi:hypothetical protein